VRRRREEDKVRMEEVEGQEMQKVAKGCFFKDR